MKPQLCLTPRVTLKNTVLSLVTCLCLALFSYTATAQVNFTVDTSSGCAPLTVTATNITTGWDTTNSTWYWYHISSNPLATDSTRNFAYTYTEPGNYEMRVVGYDQFSAYQGEYNINISVGGAGAFSPVDSAEYCPGSSISFYYNNFYNNIEWDFGDGSPTEFWNWTQHTYADTGTYTVRLVVNDMCGNDTAYQTIQVYNTSVPTPNPNASVSQACIGDQVSFNAGGLQNAYDWDFDDGDTSDQENPLHAYADTGDYMVYLTVTNICGQQATDSFYFRVDTGLYPNAWFNWSPSSCPNQMVGFNAQDPGDYNWDFGNGMTDTVQNPITYFADTGSYTVRLILTNGCGNIDTNIQNITVQYDTSMMGGGSAQIEFIGDNWWPPADTDTVCINELVGFRNSSWSGSQLSYVWYWGDGDSTEATEPGGHAYSAPGTYMVEMVRSTGCGGSDTARKWVVVQAVASPDVDLQWISQGICPGELVFFLDFGIDGGDGDFVYDYEIWFGDGDSSGTLPNGGDMGFVLDTHSYGAIGNYEVIFTATNGCGVTDTTIDTVFVNNPNPVMPMYFYQNSSNEGGGGGGPSGECPGDTVEFFVITGNDVVYDFGDGSPLDTTNLLVDDDIWHVYPGVGTYYVEMYVLTGCGTTDTILDTVNINMGNIPGGGAGVNDNFGCIGDTLWFERSNWGGGDDDGVQNEQFVWSFGDGDSAFTEDAYHVYSSGGVYTITYSVTNGCGSSMDAGLTVLIDAPNIDEAALTITDASCGAADGEVKNLAVVSPGQFTYSWENASMIQVGTNVDLTSVPAGVYSLTVTNHNGCTGMSGPHSVIETGAPVAPMATSPADYCMGDVIADLTAVGSGGTLTWYEDAALTTAITTGSPFTSGATTDSTFYVTETAVLCESPATAVVITVNPTYLLADPGITICDGDSVMIYGSYELVGATYYDTVPSIDGCDSIRSTVLTINTIAFVTAGSDATICASSTHTLTGIMGGSASSVNWTSTGDGSFNDPTTLGAIYTPGSSDSSGVIIYLIVTTDDPIGPCTPDVDSIVLTINPIATASAGLNDTICEGSSVVLAGSFGGGASSITWDNGGGDGTFDNNALTGATYTPGTSDIAAGTVTLTITTDDPIGPCTAALDIITLAINQAATVSAGSDGGNCEGPTPAPMAGAMGGSSSSITWTTTGSGTFDNTALLNAAYSASFADVTAGSVNLIITSDDPDGTGPCVADVDTMVLTLTALDSTSLGAIICDNDSTFLGGAYQNTAGSYIDSYLGTDACDSIVTTTLVVNPAYATAETAAICAGDSIVLGGSYQTVAGPYMDTLSAVSGCDSVITTTLTVNPTYATSETTVICSGDSVMLGGAYQTAPGSYMDTLSSIDGCDSIITTTLSLNPTFATAESAEICDGDSMLLGGAYQFSAGAYMDTLTSIDGCDSIITTTLTVNTVYDMTPSTSICSGDSIFLGGAFQTAPGSYVDLYTSADGCDSTVTTTLAVVTTITLTVDITICDGDSVSAGGSYQTAPGTYLDSLIASGGCDSLVTTNLTVNPVYTAVASASICDNDSIMLGGSYQNTAGVYADVYSTVDGCDSTINTTLTVFSTYNGSVNMAICSGDSILLGGSYQTMPGTYVDSMIGANGCDSIVTTNLSLNVTSTSSALANICSLDSILLGGAYQNTTGMYYDTLSTVNGCDSVIATMLYVYPVWTIDSVITSDVSGCGSTDGTINAYASGDTLPVIYSIDGFSSYNSSGSFTGLASGFYTVEIQDSMGCWSLFPVDSTVTINEPTSISVDSVGSANVIGCYGDTTGTITIIATGGTAPLSYSIDGGSNYQLSPSFTGLAAGTYNIAVEDASSTPCTGLGGTVIITEPTQIGSAGTASICDNDSIMLGGAYQNTAGIYVDTLTASGGCDSVVVTTLTVNLTYANAASASICSGDSIMLGGSYQMTAGVYVDSMTTTAGCDSITTTTLSVGATSGSSATASICQGDSIMLSGSYQMTSGSYDDVFTGANGCDSTVTTVLTIEATPIISVSPSPGVVCTFGDTVLFTALGASTYAWSPATGLDTTAGSMVNASPGSATTYTVTGTSTGGCVGSTTVDVQLSGAGAIAGFTADTTSTCEGGAVSFTNSSTDATGYAWSFSGGTTSDTTLQDPMVTYNTAGTYDVTLIAFGCGSDDTLIMSGYITVSPGASSASAVTICSSDSILLGGAYQNTAGVYSDTYTTSGGCDSTVTTTLSVDSAVSAGISATADICVSDFTYALASGLGGTPDGGGSWNDDDGSGAIILLGNIIPALIAPGTYNFTYIVSGGGACPDDSATVALTIHPAPDAGGDGTLSACSLSTSLDITTGLGGTPDSTGTWTDDDGSGALTGTNFDPSVAGLGTYNFTYSVPANAGCPAATATVTVSVVGEAIAGTSGTATICEGDFTAIVLIDQLGGPLDPNGTWSDDDGSGGLVLGQFSALFVGPGTYNFTYLVTANGCPSDSSVVTITVAAAPDAGSDGTLDVCDSTASVDVSTGLGGTPGTGGTWSDDDGTGALTVTTLDLTGLSSGSYAFTYTVSNPPCADATAVVTVNVTTCIGIGEVDGHVISLYPNPSEGKFMIDFGSEGNDSQIQVYNATGELVAVFSSEGKSDMEIDLTGKPNGLYYINVVTGGKVVTSKVSIAK